MTAALWNDRTPAKRCQWVDLLRAWAVIVMIEVHVVNTWLRLDLRPEWLNYVNGLVAPSFLMAAGFSLVLSTFRPDGTLRPFWPETAKRLGFILLCAYLLHAPGLTLAEWTVLNTQQKLRELFKIDVLQCVVYCLLLLQVLARTLGTAKRFTVAALFVALFVAWVGPSLWIGGVGDGVWLPLRGLLNGNRDAASGVQALFPLFPWIAFVSFGSFLGGLYRHFRADAVAGDEGPEARWTEAQYLAVLFGLGLLMMLWGWQTKHDWLWAGRWKEVGGTWFLVNKSGMFTWSELQGLHNTTLPSIAERLGWICMGGAALGLAEAFRPKLPGPAVVDAASKESLLLYMAHLNLIYGLLMTPFVIARTGWEWNSQGWHVTVLLVALIVGLNLLLGAWWQRMRKDQARMRTWQRAGLAVLSLNFLLGGWMTFRFYVQSPELAREAYPFLVAARLRKGLPATPDGLSRDPEEVFKEQERLGHPLDEGSKAKLAEQIRARR
jgi:uncharacterized membrane protein